jgi:hypothetical protein
MGTERKIVNSPMPIFKKTAWIKYIIQISSFYGKVRIRENGTAK